MSRGVFFLCHPACSFPLCPLMVWCLLQESNPLKAIGTVPLMSHIQIFAFIAAIEMMTLDQTYTSQEPWNLGTTQSISLMALLNTHPYRKRRGKGFRGAEPCQGNKDVIAPSSKHIKFVQVCHMI